MTRSKGIPYRGFYRYSNVTDPRVVLSIELTYQATSEYSIMHEKVTSCEMFSQLPRLSGALISFAIFARCSMEERKNTKKFRSLLTGNFINLLRIFCSFRYLDGSSLEELTACDCRVNHAKSAAAETFPAPSGKQLN